MDKELLRVVIIATGLIVIMAMLAWHYFKNRKDSGLALFAEDKQIKGHYADSQILHPERDDFDIQVKKPAEPVAETPADALFGDFDDDLFDGTEADEEVVAQPRFSAPEIIQFSIVAKSDDGFNGIDIYNAFQIAGLEYGSLKIFERLDANRLVDFGVACMVEPGTFPNTNLEDFFCPGLVFFMQPALLDDPVAVFDDFVDTVKLMAIELDGEARDHLRRPLTDDTVQTIRQSL